MTFAAFWIAFQSIKTMQAAGQVTASSLMGDRASLSPLFPPLRAHLN